jgi:hypothetical protein
VTAGIAHQLRTIPYNGRFFFAARWKNDGELGDTLSYLSRHSDLQRCGHAAFVTPQGWIHNNVCHFLWAIQELGHVGLPETAPDYTRAIVEHCQHRFAELTDRYRAWGFNPAEEWLSGIIPPAGNAAVIDNLTVLVAKTIDEVVQFVPRRATPPSPAAAAGEKVDCMEDRIPSSVLALRTEAFLPVIRSWFERSLAVPGDVAEFGCFKGTMSIKYACYLRSLKQDKTVYAFDTFEGFAINDPGGGALGVGAYADNDNAFAELQKWSTIIPVVPVKGDATQTCKVLTKPLSFVWLDLDMGVLMDPVLQHLRGLCTHDTVIGVDDYGRPETPTVKPWADDVEHRGVWKKLQEYPESFIAFYRLAN